MRLASTMVGMIITLSLSACGDVSGTDSENSNNNSTANESTNNNEAQKVPDPNRLGQNPARNFSIRLDQGNSATIDFTKIAIPAGSTIKIMEQPRHGVVSAPHNNQTTYVLKEAHTGTDSFKYAVVTADGTEYTYSVEVSIAPPTVTKLQVSTWKGNAKAAYSIVHDDYCTTNSKADFVTNGFEELNKRNLVAGFGVIVSLCDADEYADLRKMEDAGMEIINHSWSHKDLSKTDTDLKIEIDQAHTTLIGKGFNVSYFAFPYDHENDTVLRRIRDLNPGYLGARGGDNRSINEQNMAANDELAPFRAKLDCFDIHEKDVVAGKPSCSKHAKATNNDPIKVLNLYLDETITTGGWGLRELHGVGVDASWGWVSQDEYTTHLDYVATKVASGDVWMDTPTNITRYWASRAYCGSPSSTDDGKIDFDAPSNSAGCIKYATKLDVIATIEDADAISVSQDGKDIKVKSLGDNRFLFPVNPLGGKATLLRK